MRWEYRPGSELFLVWAQGKGNFGDPDNPVWQNFTENIFGNKGNNTFLVKYTYRFLRQPKTPIIFIKPLFLKYQGTTKKSESQREETNKNTKA